MTKAEIVKVLHQRVGGFSKKEASDLVDLAFDLMKETLGRGEKIKISGFGNFVLRDKRERPGRNPQTGDTISIRERRVLTFKASQVLKQALNGRAAQQKLGQGPGNSAVLGAGPGGNGASPSNAVANGGPGGMPASDNDS